MLSPGCCADTELISANLSYYLYELQWVNSTWQICLCVCVSEFLFFDNDLLQVFRNNAVYFLLGYKGINMSDSQVKILDLTAWQNKLHKIDSDQLTKELEEGKVFVLPKLNFLMLDDEINILNERLVEPGRKNISYEIAKNKLKGISKSQLSAEYTVEKFMHRYAQNAQELVNSLFPHYKDSITTGRTSLRVLDTASNKPSSYRKDDSRLHVDAFPSTPTHGRRILRLFHNINPHNVSREWRVGEPFGKLISRLNPRLTKPIPGTRKLMSLCKITKKYRSLYDHYMLQLHHKMKHDMDYQKNVSQENVSFPPGATWLVYSDQVSHAAMSGQYMLEQTFYLEVQDQLCPEFSPLKQLEKTLGCELL